MLDVLIRHINDVYQVDNTELSRRDMSYTADQEAAFGWDLEDYSDPMCPACGEPIDYCQGHGPLGDPIGWAVLEAHDDDDHRYCHELADCRKDN